jgi:CheY-like chemotaxis protein
VRSLKSSETWATGAAQPLVLVAEGNEINCAVAKALLARHGVRCALARDGAQAVRMVKEREYAAVLLDCQMPALDGYEAAARIRAAEGDRHVPIVAMSARNGPADRERCLAAGMDDCLSKPIGVAELAAVIARWVSRSDPARARGGSLA